MSVFFSNCLGIITYAEFKTLFYEQLSLQVRKNQHLSSQRQTELADALLHQLPETDEWNITLTLFLTQESFSCILIGMADRLRSQTLPNIFKQMTMLQLNNQILTVCTALNMFATAYVHTLLYKGKGVLDNYVFGFNRQLIASRLNYTGKTTVSYCRDVALYFHMEYFYFDWKKPHAGKINPVELKQAFIERFFSAVNSYQPLVSAEEISKKFADTARI